MLNAALACQNGASGNTTSVTAGATVAITPGYNPNSALDQIHNFQVRVTNNSNASCTFVLSAHRSPLSASMTNGGSTLQYAIERSGGGSIMNATGATPTASTSTASITLAAGALTTPAISLQVRLPALQSTAIAGGLYSELSPIVIEVWQLSGTVPTTRRSSVSMAVSNNKLGSCTITGAANTSQTISVGATGLTTGMAGVEPSFNVTCSGAANVVLSSQNGAVTRGGVLKTSLPTVSGFRNTIDYQASINGGAGTVTLNTATISTTPPGLFNSAAVSNRPTTVTIVPATSSVPLLAGSYSDTLTVTITPQ